MDVIFKQNGGRVMVTASELLIDGQRWDLATIDAVSIVVVCLTSGAWNLLSIVPLALGLLGYVVLTAVFNSEAQKAKVFLTSLLDLPEDQSTR